MSLDHLERVHATEIRGGYETSLARLDAAEGLRRLLGVLATTTVDDGLLHDVAVTANELAGRLAASGTARTRDFEGLAARAALPTPGEGERLRHTTDCFVCGPANPASPSVRTWREGDEAVGAVRLERPHEGPPGRAHGGAVAAVFDDVCGSLLILHKIPAFTGRLQVHYRAAWPLGETVEVRARVVEVHDRRREVTAEARRSDGSLVAEADGTFVVMSAGSIVRMLEAHGYKQA